jgi:hypothetical protein
MGGFVVGVSTETRDSKFYGAFTMDESPSRNRMRERYTFTFDPEIFSRFKKMIGHAPASRVLEDLMLAEIGKHPPGGAPAGLEEKRGRSAQTGRVPHEERRNAKKK